MEDHVKQLGVWAGLGAALGVGVALGLGLRVLAMGALIGIGAGAALGLAAGRKGEEPIALGGPARAARRDAAVALH
jgi:hypothetical protein